VRVCPLWLTVGARLTREGGPGRRGGGAISLPFAKRDMASPKGRCQDRGKNINGGAVGRGEAAKDEEPRDTAHRKKKREPRQSRAERDAHDEIGRHVLFFSKKKIVAAVAVQPLVLF
jgi:hypothetical protein